MVFGAFLIGIILRSTRFVHQALAEITPLRDIFATLFFVSIGMLLDPGLFVSNWQEILAIVLVIILLKISVIFIIVRSFGYTNRVALFSE
jgi:CPA2 family monovalent cation:H+ antiporter-2